MSYQIPDELKPLVPAYLKRRDQDIEQLQILIKNDDFDGIQKVAHNLKGHGSSYGFEVISDLGEKITQATKDKNIARISKLTSDLQSELTTIRQSMNLH
jgi:HPt (histidine-containing phosphotransfer) domain-containing protein